MEPFSRSVLDFDVEAEASRICQSIRAQLATLRRRGAVVAVSGGIDSSAVAGLCARALGSERVIGLMMPERDSAEETSALSEQVVAHLGIQAEREVITDVLEAVGCYQRRDAAIRQALPEYGEGYRSKITLPAAEEQPAYNLFSIVARRPNGETVTRRLPTPAYLGIVAATNFKQRVRKMLEYYHADLRNYAVAGTPNRLEYDQGFFVKNGDGAADIKPIAHLYKTQVYAMARHLGLPEAICSRPPTTDTYSLPQGQDEFYFALPYDKMDLCLWAKNHAVPAARVAPVVNLSESQVEHVFADIDRKRATTFYQRSAALLVEEIAEVAARRVRP